MDTSQTKRRYQTILQKAILKRACRCIAVAVGLLASGSVAASAEQVKQDLQSLFVTVDRINVTSSKLMKLIRTDIGNTWQDLEFITTSCKSGEFVTRAAGAGGLPGTWSVDTASDTTHCTTEFSTPGPKIGWPGNYVTALAADTKAGAKPVFDAAKKNSAFPADNPQYGSSGAAADAFSVHGGKSANYALIFNTSTLAAGFRNQLAQRLYRSLLAAGYTDTPKADTIEYDAGDKLPDPPGFTDKTATYQSFLDSMKLLGTQMKSGTPAETKVYIFAEAHGGIAERTVSYLDGQLGKPGGGTIVSNASPTVTLLADNPDVVAGLKQQVPKTGGGFWADDPTIERVQSPFLTFSTLSSHFVGAALVSVSLDGILIGQVDMSDPLGGDFQLSLSDETLNALFPIIDATGRLTAEFALPDSADQFQLATPEDWLLPGSDSLDYGIGIGFAVESRLEDVPEPGALPLLAGALAAFSVFLRPGRRNPWGR